MVIAFHKPVGYIAKPIVLYPIEHKAQIIEFRPKSTIRIFFQEKLS